MPQQQRAPWRKYLATLRRVPDATILAVATRDMYMCDGNRCLVATVVREALGGMLGRPLQNVSLDSAVSGEPLPDSWVCAPERAAKLFGGRVASWDAVFYDAASALPDIERAFVQRVHEAASR